MKKVLILAFVFSLAALNSCDEFCEKGSGDLVYEEYPFGGITRAEIHGSGDINYYQEDQNVALVETDDNMFDFLDIYSAGDVFVVTSDKSLCPTDFFVDLTNLGLREIVLGGSGKISARQSIEKEYFSTEILGSGDIYVFDILGDVYRSLIEGSGNIDVAGEVGYFNGTIDGSGNIFASDLIADTTIVVINGSGNIRVAANYYLKATINGSGNIYYKAARGDTALTADCVINGSGTVTKL